MYYAYVIKGLNNEFYYKGHCENLEKRLLQHNSGMTESIKMYRPFAIVYSEALKQEKKQYKERNILNLLPAGDI